MFFIKACASRFVWTADAMPSTPELIAADMAEQSTDPGDAADPGHTADTLTGKRPSSNPRDGRIFEKRSNKKRTRAENGNCATVREEKQQSKLQKACTQSQTDKTAGQAHGEVSSQKGKLSRQSSCNGQHNGQLQTDGQSNGQHITQHKGAERDNGQHKGDGQSRWQPNGQPKHDGQSGGQAEAADSRQLRNSHSSPRPLSNGSPSSGSEPVSDSRLGEELEDEEEEEEADVELGSLGNVDIATASSQVLSWGMLHGLKAGLQARLSLYATNTTAEDMQQLREVQEANAR